MNNPGKGYSGFGLTIFLSAFLLFQVQPLIGKHILPWFGGSPAVWTVCLLFFQVFLLAGYGYAHWIAGRRRRRRWLLVHLLVLIVTVLFLPVVPHEAWKPGGGEPPFVRILLLLAATVGGPYFALSTTGPLLQAWFRVTHPGREPYRLYALSNAGSLLGLLTYPFLFEPLMTRHSQAVAWSGAYLCFVLACGWCTVRTAQAASGRPPAGVPHAGKGEDPLPRRREVLVWIALAAGGSVLLLATTNQMCQGLAVVPFLWVLPLSIYLLTFIIVFESGRWYRRGWAIPFLAMTVAGVAWVIHRWGVVPLALQITVYSAALFAGCMLFHGELARAKPAPRSLTLFFLALSFGGALGGVLVSVAAPLLLKGYWEYHLSLMAALALALGIILFSPSSPWRRGWNRIMWIPALLVFAGLSGPLVKSAYKDVSGALALSRSFYGVLKVSEELDRYDIEFRVLHHGMVVHGIQHTDPDRRTVPTAYFGEETGVWLALRNHPRRLAGEPMKIGVLGLGAGTVAAFGGEGDEVRFYELNPEVVSLSREWFTFREDTPALVDVVLGDGRLQLEREAAQGERHRFDVLVADAFTGGSIPLHLLTVECADIYRRHLKSDGILAVNISNRHLDLAPVVFGLAESLGWKAILLDTWGDPQEGVWDATWVLITGNRDFLESPAVVQAQEDWPAEKVVPLRWTDDYVSLFHVLKPAM